MTIFQDHIHTLRLEAYAAAKKKQAAAKAQNAALRFEDEAHRAYRADPSDANRIAYQKARQATNAALGRK